MEILIDEFIELDKHDVDELDVLFIDVPDKELAVLRGAHATIAKFKPELFIKIYISHDPSKLIKVHDFMANLVSEYHIKTQWSPETAHIVYLHLWHEANEPTNIKTSTEPTPDRTIGELLDGELEQRQVIRSRRIPGSGGPDPNVFNIKFVDRHAVKFRKGTFDEWNSWFEFGAEIDVRETFWYPNIRKGDVVVDAGATWGSYALTAAILGAHVYAYEPDYRIFPELVTNIKLNGLDDSVVAYNCGLSDHYHRTDWDELKNIELVKLDEHLNGKIDFIKIDVEGQELAVLEGARESITKYKPKILLEAHLSYDKAMLAKAAEMIMKTGDGYHFNVYDNIPSRDTIYGYFYFARTK